MKKKLLSKKPISLQMVLLVWQEFNYLGEEEKEEEGEGHFDLLYKLLGQAE